MCVCVSLCKVGEKHAEWEVALRTSGLTATAAKMAQGKQNKPKAKVKREKKMKANVPHAACGMRYATKYAQSQLTRSDWWPEHCDLCITALELNPTKINQTCSLRLNRNFGSVCCFGCSRSASISLATVGPLSHIYSLVGERLKAGYNICTRPTLVLRPWRLCRNQAKRR